MPDLPGCVTADKTRDAVVARTREATAFHLAGMRADGEPLPEPKSDPG